MANIELLRDKLDQLLRQYAVVKADVSKLKRVVDVKKEECAQLRRQLGLAEEQLLALQIGQAIPDAESRASSRKKLDTVIAEIDKILITLND
jgi:hypothetical protein